MFKAMLITEENSPTCKRLLGVNNLPMRHVETPTWIIWTFGHDPTAWTLPQAIFTDRYTVVEVREHISIVERI